MTTVQDRLYFSSDSADLPVGQGVHERVADAACYSALAVRHWRRMLSNFWPAAMLAKFGQHEPLRVVLLASVPAQLWHGTGRGQPPARIHDLEATRDALRR